MRDYREAVAWLRSLAIAALDGPQSEYESALRVIAFLAPPSLVGQADRLRLAERQEADHVVKRRRRAVPSETEPGPSALAPPPTPEPTPPVAVPASRPAKRAPRTKCWATTRVCSGYRGAKAGGVCSLCSHTEWRHDERRCVG